MAHRLCVIGLDCVPPEFLYGPWLDEMPNFRRLIQGGFHGHLVSTIPPITVPAWMAMMTSRDPGMLGIYGFRNRASYDYSDVFTVNATHVKARTVWNHLSRARLRSIVLGVPLTWPPRPLRGVMASSFLTPDKSVQWTWPAELAPVLEQAAGGEYIIDVRDFRNERKQETLDQIHRMTRARFRAFRHLLRHEDWDFAMMVEMGPDRLHHAFWRYTDPTHRLYEPGNPYENVMHDYYLELDAEIGRTLDALPPDTSVIVVSDHGAKAMHGAICINEWLIDQGLLVLHEYPDAPTRLRTEMIDWTRTAVWGEGVWRPSATRTGTPSERACTSPKRRTASATAPRPTSSSTWATSTGAARAPWGTAAARSTSSRTTRVPTTPTTPRRACSSGTGAAETSPRPTDASRSTTSRRRSSTSSASNRRPT